MYFFFAINVWVNLHIDIALDLLNYWFINREFYKAPVYPQQMVY